MVSFYAAQCTRVYQYIMKLSILSASMYYARLYILQLVKRRVI